MIPLESYTDEEKIVYAREFARVYELTRNETAARLAGAQVLEQYRDEKHLKSLVVVPEVSR